MTDPSPAPGQVWHVESWVLSGPAGRPADDAGPAAQGPRPPNAEVDPAPSARGVLVGQEDWTPALSPDGRPTLYHRSEALLTAWMREHLALTWVVHDAPWEAEADPITALAPPLNVSENAAHPLYALVRERRARWAAQARTVG